MPANWDWTQAADIVVQALPKVGTSLLVFLAFWLASIIFRRVIVAVAKSRGIENAVGLFLGRIVRTVIIAFGGVTALGTAGIDIGALVAGLGLTGFAIGFAMKDIISNVLAGLLINIYKPFRLQNHIKVSSFEGKVTEMDLRYTVLESEGKRIFVPNSLLFTNAIIVTDERAAAEPV